MRFFGVVSGRAVQSQNFGIVYGQSGTEFQTVIRLCVLFLCFIAGKMNNILVV